MKRTLLIASLLVIFAAASLWADTASLVTTAAGGSPSSAQVSCGATATLLKAATVPSNTSYPMGRLSIIFQNHGTNPVYIAPRSDISTSNAGILLDTTRGLTLTIDRSGGDVAWYCITSSSTSTVGWTEEK